MDVVEFIGICRVCRAMAEEGKQNNWTATPANNDSKNWVNGDSKVGCVSQQTLEKFPHPSIGENDSLSELLKPPGQNSHSGHYIGTPG